MKLCSQYHQGLYTWTRALRKLFVYAEFTKKGFELLTVGAGSPAHHSHGRQKVSIPEWDLTGRRVVLDHSSSLWASSPKTFFLVCAPSTPLRIGLPETETTVILKSASFVVIMHLHEGLTHIQSQIKPRLLFGESFTLRWDWIWT